MSELDQVRSAIADQRGLGMTALPFIDGTTIEELESSADRLAELIAAHRGRSRPEPERDIFTEALAAKTARKQELLAMFSGRSTERQPRDQAGRFARTSGFDGGARPTLPPSPPSHDQWLGEVVRRRRADQGIHF